MIGRARDETRVTLAQLAEQVGQRPPTSPQEATAAAFINARLRRAGLRMDTRELRAARWRGQAYLPLALLGLALALGAPLLPQIALPLGLWLLLALLADALVAPLPALGQRRLSQDIIGNRAVGDDDGGGHEPHWRALLLAPLDTQPAWRGLARLGGPGRGAALARLLGPLTTIGAALLSTAAPLLAWLLAAIGALMALLLLIAAVRPPALVTNDGGIAALAALVAAVQQLGDLRQIELWAAGVGAASADSAGVELLARRFPFPPERTIVIAFQEIAGPELVYVSREDGLLGAPADPLLLRLAAEVDAEDTSIDAEPRAQPSVDTFLTPLRRRGYRTLSILAPSGSGPPAPPDALVERAARLAVGILQRLDAGDEDQYVAHTR